MSDDPAVAAVDRELIPLALEHARAGLAAGGVPVGAVLAAGGSKLRSTRNRHRWPYVPFLT